MRGVGKVTFYLISCFIFSILLQTIANASCETDVRSAINREVENTRQKCAPMTFNTWKLELTQAIQRQQHHAGQGHPIDDEIFNLPSCGTSVPEFNVRNDNAVSRSCVGQGTNQMLGYFSDAIAHSFGDATPGGSPPPGGRRPSSVPEGTDLVAGTQDIPGVGRVFYDLDPATRRRHNILLVDTQGNRIPFEDDMSLYAHVQTKNIQREEQAREANPAQTQPQGQVFCFPEEEDNTLRDVLGVTGFLVGAGLQIYGATQYWGSVNESLEIQSRAEQHAYDLGWPYSPGYGQYGGGMGSTMGMGGAGLINMGNGRQGFGPNGYRGGGYIQGGGPGSQGYARMGPGGYPPGGYMGPGGVRGGMGGQYGPYGPGGPGTGGGIYMDTSGINNAVNGIANGVQGLANSLNYRASLSAGPGGGGGYRDPRTGAWIQAGGGGGYRDPRTGAWIQAGGGGGYRDPRTGAWIQAGGGGGGGAYVYDPNMGGYVRTINGRGAVNPAAYRGGINIQGGGAGAGQWVRGPDGRLVFSAGGASVGPGGPGGGGGYRDPRTGAWIQAGGGGGYMGPGGSYQSNVDYELIARQAEANARRQREEAERQRIQAEAYSRYASNRAQLEAEFEQFRSQWMQRLETYDQQYYSAQSSGNYESFLRAQAGLSSSRSGGRLGVSSGGVAHPGATGSRWLEGEGGVPSRGYGGPRGREPTSGRRQSFDRPRRIGDEFVPQGPGAAPTVFPRPGGRE